jgi:hypothetical protein
MLNKTTSQNARRSDMEKRRFPAVIAAITFAGMLAGCTDTQPFTPDDGVPPAGVTNESEALAYYAVNEAFTANENESFTDRAIEPTDYGTFGSSGTEITPLTWGRFVDNVETTTSMTMDDSIATVQVTRMISGTLRILALDIDTTTGFIVDKVAAGDTTTILIEKLFVDQSVRNVVFKRVGNEAERYWLNWTPIATSLVEGETVNPPATQELNLTSVEVTRPNGEVFTITDPTNTYLRFRNDISSSTAAVDVLEMSQGETFSVRATVVSAATNPDMLVLRYGFSAVSRKRVEMDIVSETPNGDGTYTRVFETTADVSHHPGYFHIGVVAKTMRTIWDSDPAYYSVNWWGVPYRVQ